MSVTKNVYPKISSQRPIVFKAETPSEPPVDFVIPGGQSIFEDFGKDQLAEPLYNWLRRVNKFHEVTFSLVENPDGKNLTVVKAEVFDSSSDVPIWEKNKLGRKVLVDYFIKWLKPSVVAIKATKDGVYVYKDKDFKLYREATAEDVEAYKAFDIELKVGDKVPADTFEPRLIFLPKAKQRTK